MKKTMGVLAHVDAGKTTFIEDVLYHTKSIRKKGRVDHKDSFLDTNSIEKERGITIFSDQAFFEYNSSQYYLVDTPGHADFSSEMERAVSVMDYAVVIISAAEGIQSQTEVVWNILKKHNIPVFFFINKIDRAGADVKAVLEDIKSNFTEDACLITDDLSKENMSDNLKEFISEHDDNLLEMYLDDKYDYSIWLDSLIKMIKRRNIFPCMVGSALKDTGIDDFLEKFDMLTYTNYSLDGDFGGIVYKIRHDSDGTKLTFVKGLNGTLNVRDSVKLQNGTVEKISRIKIYSGLKSKIVDCAFAGDIFAVTGLSSAVAGEGIGNIEKIPEYDIVPALKSKVIFDKSLNEKEVLGCFKMLEAEEPSLDVEWDEKLKEIEVHIMGVIQLEVLKEIVKKRFSISVEFGQCEILYKETIAKKTVGYGHFEPLRHYAEVHLMLEPNPRNRRITFENKCKAEDLTIGNQNLIKSHIFEREHHGILTGSPVTDIRVTLLTGRASNKHTSGGDFREATLRALRQGLESTENILLEPYYRFKIESPKDYMGRILSDIQKLKGSFEPPLIYEDKVRIKGRGPVSTFMNYSIELTSFTRGEGKINLLIDGYDLCHNAQEVIEKIGYNKDADIDYTSTSVFCSKGQSYLVKGSEAKQFMHCLK